MKRFLRNAAYRFTAKRVDEEALTIQQIRMDEKDVSYFNLSTNPILSFVYDGKLYYFRECFALKRKKDYFADAVTRFFQTIHQFGIPDVHFKQSLPIRVSFSDEEVQRFQQWIECRLPNRAFFKALSSISLAVEREVFSIWDDPTVNADFFKCLGFEDLDEDLYEIAVYFVWYMRSVALNYQSGRIVKGKKHSFFNAVKAVSSCIVAEELGYGNMITAARFCQIEFTGGGSLFGVLSEAAKGCRMSDIDLSANGSLQSELLILNALDLVCYQPDHAPNNYNLFDDMGKCLVCAFDNDNPKTFFPIPLVNHSLSSASPMINKQGKILRPHFPKDAAEKIKNADPIRLKKRLKPYLNGLQIWALLQRLKKLKVALGEAEKQNEGFLLSDEQFNQATVQAELDSGYVTYLSKAVQDTRE